ncbi:MAG: hypothetical protein ABI895_35785 [Deltaproteobacteria bacterium]
MNDSDVLQRAAALLRAAHDGQREGSGFTRARILTSLAERRRPRRWRWLVLGPLGTLLIVGSAWAQSTGNWSRVWQAVASVLGSEQPVSAPPRGATAAQAAPRLPTAPLPDLPPLGPAVPEAVVPEPVAPGAASAPPVPPEPAVTPAPAARAKAPKRSGAPTAPGSRPPEPAPADPELSQFRTAHELQLQAQGNGQGQRRAAIDAYAQYLRAYPQGRFVPEARYNTALDWIQLGDVGAARAALAPFADGAYGGYRQQEARKLLEALGAANESPPRR